MNLADKINFLMKRNNIKNPKELSEKLTELNKKIPYTTLLTIINNEVQDIKLGTARKLCDFFHITLDELLDDDISIESSISDIKLASYNGLNTEGMNEIDLKEIQEFIDFKKELKKQKEG